jgi:hypothetical protein
VQEHEALTSERFQNPLDPDWMGDILQGGSGQGRLSVQAVNPLPPLAGASSPIPLEIRYAEGSPAGPARVILKRSSHMNVELGNLTEVSFYQNAAPEMWRAKNNPPILRCYSALTTPDGRSYQLVLKDCTETHNSRSPTMLPPTLQECEWIMDALADLHAFWWDHSMFGEWGSSLPTRESIQTDLDRDAANYARLADFLGDRLAPSRRAMFEHLLECLPEARTRRLASGRGLTLIHDDPHAGNFLYPRNPELHRLLLIDWKSWSIQPGPADLAHMMGVFWFPERRARLEQPLLRRYLELLVSKGVTGYAWDDLWFDYRLAICGLLFYPAWQWSMGLPDWMWWSHLERLVTAYEDLHCEEVL